MKQTIEIEVPDGKKAVWKDNKVVFEDIKPLLPKTWKEFCKNYPCKKEECFLGIGSSICQLYTEDNKFRCKEEDRNVLPSKQAAEQHLALMQLHQLRDCYRQGWIPDYMDYSRKWYITKFKNKPYVDSVFSYSPFLSFQTKDLAEEFLNNFKDLIEQAGDLI